jgi:excisionase family DNA binding protein
LEINLKEFLTIDDVSEYLSIKRSTLYSMVESGEIAHYRVGRLIRFKKQDVDVWMESQRKERIDTDKKARGVLKAMNRPVTDINSMVKKTIAEVKGNLYTPGNGRPDRDKDLGKGVSDGTLS